MCKLRVILIGGSSNIGKSTLAESLAIKLGWRQISTDSLARHPGRPWRTKPESVPLHVAEHYLSLSADALIEDLLRHYRSMWPNLESMITRHATNDSTERLILEGAALWPEFVATLNLDNVAAIWLTASNDFLQARIHQASQFEEATVQGKVMIQKFLERTYRYNGQMMNAIKRLGLVSINVETTASLNELSDICLEALIQK
jgi:2-phosphoglycerate kinase